MPTGSCPNSDWIDEDGRLIETACRCPDHHPGLTVHMPPELRPVVRLSVVTRGEPVERVSAQDKLDGAIAKARASCTACGGDPERCLEGTGAPHFNRLLGCAAFTDAGSIKPLQAKPSPRQPWDPRPARARRAA